MTKSLLTHCRCGAPIVPSKSPYDKYGVCSKYNNKSTESFVKHEIFTQQFAHLHGVIHWEVRREGDKFRAYAGNDPSPYLFDTEDTAYLKLDEVYWGRDDW